MFRGHPQKDDSSLYEKINISFYSCKIHVNLRAIKLYNLRVAIMILINPVACERSDQ